MSRKLSDVFKSKKVVFAFLVFALFAGIIAFSGFQYGMDLNGGSIIQVNLESENNATIDTQTLITVLQNRLNAFGMKDISVKPWGNPVQYVTVEIAETDPEAINNIQAILGQQGKFETLFKGKVVLSGTDVISVITDPQQGYGITGTTSGFEWQVPFMISAAGAQNLADEIDGQCSTPAAQNCPETLYMFIDRPENAVIVMPSELANSESAIQETLVLTAAGSTVTLEEITRNSGVELIISNDVSAEVLNRTAGKNVVIPVGYYNETAFTTAEKVIVKQKTGDYWIASALSLDNIVHLTPGVTNGKPITQPTITGYSSTQAAAQQDVDRIVILLKSGKLPVSVSVGSVSTISPTVGKEFLQYSAMAGIIAIFVVAGCLFARYRKPKLVVPIMFTLVFEVTITLGIASLMGQQLDLAALAGVIAAIGVGIDDQIIILDSLLLGRKEDESEMSGIAKIKRAFSVIFMSAGLIICAMAPLFFSPFVALKGFATTTIIGVLVGIFITRPAYAEIVDRYI